MSEPGINATLLSQHQYLFGADILEYLHSCTGYLPYYFTVELVIRILLEYLVHALKHSSNALSLLTVLNIDITVD